MTKPRKSPDSPARRPRSRSAKAEKRRDEPADSLLDFFAEAPLGLLFVGAAGHIERVNSAQLRMFGCAEADALDRSVAERFVKPEWAAELLRQLRLKKTVRNFRAQLRHVDGSILQVLIDANGLWQGNVFRYSRWYVRDITERIELERAVVQIAEREQQRFGRDLHDDLCQQLVGMEFLVQQLAALPARREKASLAALDTIAALLRRAINYTREMARGLAPVQSEARGLMHALRELARRTRAMNRIDCRFHCDAPIKLGNHPASSHLYRIAQEAVNNAVRHGRPRGIEIGLAETRRGLVLKIRDNGVGLPRASRMRPGAGLQIMNYRADAIGGILEVRRHPRAGTEVVCTVPPVSRHLLDAIP